MKFIDFTALVLIVYVFFVSCAEQPQQKQRQQTQKHKAIFHKSHEPAKAALPFSDVVQAGDFWYLSGQIGIDHKTRTLVPGGIQVETTQTLENIRQVLELHDLSLNDVVKVTVILDDMNDFSSFNEVYTAYFPKKPARTTFAAESLAMGAAVEIEVVAFGGNVQSKDN